MTNTKIFHNPRCSKSRQTLSLLEEHNESIEIIEYLKNPPTVEELITILDTLGMHAHEIIRKGEKEYKELSLADKSLSNEEFVKIMVENPKLIERPIVLKNNKAAIGRPPENVLNIL